MLRPRRCRRSLKSRAVCRCAEHAWGRVAGRCARDATKRIPKRTCDDYMSWNQRATNEQIITAYAKYGSVWKAAESLGLCGQSVWERLKVLGIKLQLAAWHPEEIEAVRELAGQGMPIFSIASRLGRTYAGIACKLSELGIKHPYQNKSKIRRGVGFTKRNIQKVVARLGDSVSLTKLAHQFQLSTTGLANALQAHAPLEWKQYVAGHAELGEHVCSGCGQQFQPLQRKQKYCSTVCGAHARADTKYFSGNRLSAIGLAEHTCQVCARTDKPLSVHHIFGKENDPRDQYLIALCPGCHQLVTWLARLARPDEPWILENLIILAITRNQGRRKPKGWRVTVEMDELTSPEVLQMIGGANDDSNVCGLTATKQYGRPVEVCSVSPHSAARDRKSSRHVATSAGGNVALPGVLFK